MKKIRKAVIPAAGLGTRVLPATKAMPKEMLPIVDRPAIQFIVEEAVAAGITDILIITNRGKGLMEDHFDRAPELEIKLSEQGKDAILDEVVGLSKLANIFFLRQKETKGLGHAVLCARNFIGDDHFAVLYGDDVIIGGERPACAELCAAYEEFGKGALGIKQCTTEAIQKYSSLKVEPIRERLFHVTDMIEKPKPEEILSHYAILGRCILPPSIFDILEKTGPGAGGEIQLTDAMRELALKEGMVGVEYTGKRYDMGNKLGIMQAAVEVALKHPEIGEEFREYLMEYTETLRR